MLAGLLPSGCHPRRDKSCLHHLGWTFWRKGALHAFCSNARSGVNAKFGE